MLIIRLQRSTYIWDGFNLPWVLCIEPCLKTSHWPLLMCTLLPSWSTLWKIISRLYFRHVDNNITKIHMYWDWFNWPCALSRSFWKPPTDHYCCAHLPLQSESEGQLQRLIASLRRTLIISGKFIKFPSLHFVRVDTPTF